jgi:hypothetical protein
LLRKAGPRGQVRHSGKSGLYSFASSVVNSVRREIVDKTLAACCMMVCMITSCMCAWLVASLVLPLCLQCMEKRIYVWTIR